MEDDYGHSVRLAKAGDALGNLEDENPNTGALRGIGYAILALAAAVKLLADAKKEGNPPTGGS